MGNSRGRHVEVSVVGKGGKANSSADFGGQHCFEVPGDRIGDGMQSSNIMQAFYPIPTGPFIHLIIDVAFSSCSLLHSSTHLVFPSVLSKTKCSQHMVRAPCASHSARTPCTPLRATPV